MTDKVNSDDAVPDGDLRVAVLWGDVAGCPVRGGHEKKQTTVEGELRHLHVPC